MIVVVLGISAAILAVVLHSVVVRRVPRRMRMIALALSLVGGVIILGVGLFALDVAIPSYQLLLSLILAASLVMDYAIIFTAIEADSPTLSIISEILERGGQGLPSGAISEFAGRRPFVQSRIDALVESKVLAQEGDFFAARGNMGHVLKIAEFYRRLCGYRETTG